MPNRAPSRQQEDPRNLLDPRRSAHASIRGYLYQTCLGVLRWLDLEPNEILLCEGDEDLDRFLLGGGAVSEQVKAYTGGLSITDRVVRDSLRNFLRSYVTLRRRNKIRRFVFTTTAYEKKKRAGGLDLDLLAAWKQGNRNPEVIAKVRSLVEPLAEDPHKEKTEKARAWLDQQAEGWAKFMDSVEWSFDSPDLDGILRKIRNHLATQENTRELPAVDFLNRLIARILEASIQKKPRDRTLTCKDLAHLIKKARADLATWAASPMVGRIRAILDEVGQIRRLLHHNTDSLPPNASPGKLLTAAYEVIPFKEKGRREELDFLASWCEGTDQRNVLLLTGEGGAGKTRLMIEWCRRLRHQGWHAGFLRKDRGEGDLDPLLEGSAPRLVAVDYAEARLVVVESLLLKMGLAADGEGPKMRLVLLARRVAGWWNNLIQSDRYVGDLLSSSEPKSITALVSSNPEERRQAFAAAVESFAWQLGREGPANLHVPDLTHRDFDYALYFHMAALAALQGEQIETAEDALEQTLAHEYRFWRNQVQGLGLDRPQEKLLIKGLETAVAAVTLVGGTNNLEQSLALLDRTLEPLSLLPYLRDTVLDLIEDLYLGFGGSGGRHLDPLGPDLLGEQWIAAVLDQDRSLLTRIVVGGSSEECNSILTVLTRLARRRPELQRWIGIALQDRLEYLAELALDVAVETGDPIGLELAKEIEKSGAMDVVLQIQKLCDEERYQLSVPLREVALVTTEKGFQLLRERRADFDKEQQVEFATLANNLGIRLSELGRREDALEITQEVAEIYRQLVQLQPGTYERGLARSLNNLGLVLGKLGRREDALVATLEALEIRRQLAQRRPDAFRPDLASSLNSLSLRLSDLGRCEEALITIRGAVKIYRQLAQLDPDTPKPELSTGLHNLGKVLSEVGQCEEAFDATQEAVEIRRQLARLRPDVFRPVLATSLNNLGTMLSELGRHEEAFFAAEEAVRTLSPFFSRFPAAFASWMATMVRNYRKYAAAAGKEPDEALLAPIAEVLQSLPAAEDQKN